MLESRNPLTSIDRNPLLRSLLWHTFYRQFCAGETPSQVARVNAELRAQGYSGVILEYALEVLKDAEGAEANEERDVGVWRRRMLETVAMASPGDFVGLKWSGMGPAAMRRMKEDREPSAAMEEAMHALCAAARDRRTSLLPAAEETWSLTYLKQTPETISRHLALAQKENFTLGLKLVRGAYLGSEERALIHPSIEATHAAYDGIMASLIRREPNTRITTPADAWPKISVVLATHNAVSVQLAQSLRHQQFSRGEPLTQLSFAQLQGMADEVSCTLIAAAKAAEESAEEAAGKGQSSGAQAVRERVYKCTTWGSMGECLNYLLRRAAENKDAAGRTQETRRAMRGEIGRRVRGVDGLA
ncbi:proline dehydrogenase [Friedmanniomyces endolithicus]|nr:proline dehydrogenase [Friedmanniomyces endolithicus]